MNGWQALFYLAAVVLLFFAAFVPQVGRASLGFLAAGFALLAYAQPGIAHLIGS